MNEVRRSRRCDDPFAYTLPVQSIEQSFELRSRQTQNAVADPRPLEMAFAEALVDQNKPRAVP